MSSFPKSLVNLLQRWRSGGRFGILHNEKRAFGVISYLFLNCKRNILINRFQKFNWNGKEHFSNLKTNILVASVGGLSLFANQDILCEEENDIEEQMEIENRYSA